MTTSAFGGRAAVVRCPYRIFEGSLCQYDFVELVVGRPAWPGNAVVPVMMFMYSNFSNLYLGDIWYDRATAKMEIGSWMGVRLARD